jgi:hypothetical protein
MRPSHVFLLFILAGLASSVFTAGPSRAEVVVFDRLTSIDTPVFLKVQTKGWLFPRGGRRVRIRVGDGETRTVLSGGDGLAYLKIEPRQSGISEIEAVSGRDRSLGHLLVIPPEASVVIIGAENSLKMSVFSDQERKESQPAIEAIAKHFRIVYVTEWLAPRSVKEWLAQKKYPLSVVMRWQGSGTLNMLRNQKISVAAVVGSEAMLKAAGPEIPYRYSFEKSRYGRSVSDWSEIEDLMPLPPK